MKCSYANSYSMSLVNYFKSLLNKPERSVASRRTHRRDRCFAMEGLENRTLLTVNLVETAVVEEDFLGEDGSFGGDGIVDSIRMITSTLNPQGDLLSNVVQIDWDLDGIGDIVVSTTTNSYSPQGNLLQTVVEGPGGVQTTTNTYDPQGNLVERVFENDFDFDGVVDLISTITNDYDARGSLLETTTEVDTNADGTVDDVFSRVYSYDLQGNLLTEVGSDDYGADGIIDIIGTTGNTYDPQGNHLTSLIEIDYGVDGVIDWTTTIVNSYDPSGNLVHSFKHDSADFGWFIVDSAVNITYAYDVQGNQVGGVAELDFDGDGVVDGTETFTAGYDVRGNLLERVTSSTYFGVPSFTNVEGYSYDPRGDLTESYFISYFDGDFDGIADEFVAVFTTYSRTRERV